MAARCPHVILVMGVTGVGKSTFIKAATGCSVEVGEGLKSCRLNTEGKLLLRLMIDAGTAKVQCYQIPGTDVYLMDTPGFDDTHISDADILSEIATSLVDAFNDQAEIQGAIYIHPVVEARMRGSGVKNLIMFRKVLGMNGMKNCLLVTTKWSLQDAELSEARERELCEKKEFWQPLIAYGARVMRFKDSMKSAIEIIKPLIQGPPFEPLLVEEVVRKHKPLSQTQAGQVVNDDIGEANKAHEAAMADLRAEEAAARDRKDLEFAEILRKERKEHEDKVQKLAEDAKLLAQPVKKSGGFFRWVARGLAFVAGSVATAASGGTLGPAAILLYGITHGATADDD